MSTKAVNTSLALILLMILSSLSYSLTNEIIEEIEYNDEDISFNTANSLTYNPLIPQTRYYENTESPGYIGITHDDRIIVYSEAPDSRGDFSNSISIYSYSEYG